MEIYSIDEAFLNFDGMDYEDLQKHCEEIRAIRFRSTGIPISIGGWLKRSRRRRWRIGLLRSFR